MATCNFQVYQSQEKEIENQVLMKKCLFQWFWVTLIDVFIQKISITPPLPFLVWMLCSACDQTEWAWWWMCSVKITGDHLNTFVTQQPHTDAIKAKRLITFHLLFIKHELIEVYVHNCYFPLLFTSDQNVLPLSSPSVLKSVLYLLAPLQHWGPVWLFFTLIASEQ